MRELLRELRLGREVSLPGVNDVREGCLRRRGCSEEGHAAVWQVGVGVRVEVRGLLGKDAMHGMTSNLGCCREQSNNIQCRG